MIVLGVLLGMAIYQVIRILKSTRQMSEDISETYDKAKTGVNKIVASISQKFRKTKK
jgi:hypothetical protein